MDGVVQLCHRLAVVDVVDITHRTDRTVQNVKADITLRKLKISRQPVDTGDNLMSWSDAPNLQKIQIRQSLWRHVMDKRLKVRTALTS